MAETWTGAATPWGAVEMQYVQAETRAGKLRRLANDLADLVDRAMANGTEDEVFQPWAEAADELIRIADFIEPPATWQITSNVVRAEDVNAPHTFTQ